MSRWLFFVFLALSQVGLNCAENAPAKRLVIIKIDGLSEDLLEEVMNERDPATGQSRLPWLARIFRENGTVFRNFYVRGLSLSAPSWSMLDTGQHAIIRGNAEFDRYTGRVYDYLNFFPLYLNYARKRQVDMPGVEVLDRAGIPLLIDSVPYEHEYQSFQLFQRGVRWSTLRNVLGRRVKVQLFLAPVESVGPTGLSNLLEQQTEAELRQGLTDPQMVYLDYFTGDADHQGHATNERAALADTLRHIDSLTGRLWTAIGNTALAKETELVVVSDHGMNNRPDVFSQAFSLPDFFGSAEGGAHHVVTNRNPMSDYAVKGLYPLVQRVVTPSRASFYLAGEASQYPTAWFDLDGNERAAVQLRESDLNEIHILLKQMGRHDLPPALRRAAGECIGAIVDRHRAEWTRLRSEMNEELSTLETAIARRKDEVGEIPRRWTDQQHDRGEDKVARRLKRDLTWWQRESLEYRRYLNHIEALLAWDGTPRLRENLYVPEQTLGGQNTLANLQHYVVGPAASGLKLDESGHLDEEQSFRHVDYPRALLAARVRNNTQAKLSSQPVDFIAAALPEDAASSFDPQARQAYWLYAGEDRQLVVMTDEGGRIALRPLCHLRSLPGRPPQFESSPWAAGFPLQLWEDPAFASDARVNRAAWLSSWHTETEWMNAIHRCRYSNGVIGIVELLSPVGPLVPGPSGSSSIAQRYERRRRELVNADLQVFAKDGWNFNVRSFNPGGNHGSFLRPSTHSVWMMAGAGIPAQTIDEPFDSLAFASTMLCEIGKTPPHPEHAVAIRSMAR